MMRTSDLSADAKEFIPQTLVPPFTYVYPPPLPPPPIVFLPHPMGFYAPIAPALTAPAPPVFHPAPRASRAPRSKTKPPTASTTLKTESLFELRPEEFPTLPVSTTATTSQIEEKSSTPVLPAWTTVVSRPQSKSPHSTRAGTSSLPTNCSTPQRSQSSVSTEQSKRSKKKSSRKKKKDLDTAAPSPAAPLDFNNERDFPSLGQEAPPIDQGKPSNTPGLIPKSRVKAQHTFEIRLTDMFNALSTSTRPKVMTKQAVNAPMGANPLDSHPAPKRGKERENPKPRKPTKLKRIINKELEEKQKNVGQSPPTDQTSMTSCSEQTDDDEDDDEDIQPTSQSQTPFAQQYPSSTMKQQIHDGTFREYCSQLIDRQLDELCIQLLLTLKRFQDRKRQQLANNPDRARRKRRFVHGIREVTKHLRGQRLKCVLIAPDCQSIQSEGGLNQAIEQIIQLCHEQNVPVIFTLTREKLGRCLNKISRISTIGIFDYSGADAIYKEILHITEENRRAYKQILDGDETVPTTSHGLNKREFFKVLHRTFQQHNQPRAQIVNHIPNDSMGKAVPKVPAHHGHSRQTSDTSMIYIDPQLINAMKKQHTRASSGTFEFGMTKKTHQHQRTLSDGAAAIDLGPTPIKHHSRTPSGCSAISQIEQQDYFEQSKHILLHNGHSDAEGEPNGEDYRLKSIHEDTEEISANTKRKNVEKWINEN